MIIYSLQSVLQERRFELLSSMSESGEGCGKSYGEVVYIIFSGSQAHAGITGGIGCAFYGWSSDASADGGCGDYASYHNKGSRASGYGSPMSCAIAHVRMFEAILGSGGYGIGDPSGQGGSLPQARVCDTENV